MESTNNIDNEVDNKVANEVANIMNDSIFVDIDNDIHNTVHEGLNFTNSIEHISLAQDYIEEEDEVEEIEQEVKEEKVEEEEKEEEEEKVEEEEEEEEEEEVSVQKISEINLHDNVLYNSKLDEELDNVIKSSPDMIGDYIKEKEKETKKSQQSLSQQILDFFKKCKCVFIKIF